MKREEIVAAVNEEVSLVLGQRNNDGEPWSGEGLIAAIAVRIADRMAHLTLNEDDVRCLASIRNLLKLSEVIGQIEGDEWTAEFALLDRLTGATS